MNHAIKAGRLNRKANLRSFDERYALERAYVPEHIPGLMAKISKGVPFLVDEYLGFAGEKWMILVGYPLENQFTLPGCEKAIHRARAEFQPETLLFIGPEIPPSLLDSIQERSQDDYYSLDLDGHQLRPRLARLVRKASERMVVVREYSFHDEHDALTAEFLKSHPLPRMVSELYRSMPDYLAHSSSAVLLCARDLRGNLCAYYVVDQAARAFDAYILGCYSRKHFIPNASDLLFQAMIDLAREQRKPTINLGLGVNDGIRRFKRKWGGVPYLHYEYCECYFGPPKALSMLEILLEGKL